MKNRSFGKSKPSPSRNNTFLDWQKDHASGAVPRPNGLYRHAADQDLWYKQEYCLDIL